MGKRMTAVGAAMVVAVALLACKGGNKGGDKSTGASGDKPAAPKQLTNLTVAQVNEAREMLRGNNEFAKHTAIVTAKLGPPQKVEGDQSFWYGYDAASDDCQQLSTSATKGSGTESVQTKGHCVGDGATGAAPGLPPVAAGTAAGADPKSVVRERAVAFSKLVTEMQWRAVTADEACEYFTCDSMTTRAQVDGVLKDKAAAGRRGWRWVQVEVPASRVEAKPNGDVSVVVETHNANACLTPGGPTDVDDGVHGCKKAQPRPWKQACSTTSYTFANIAGVWKRTGKADVTDITCPKE
jgi:hypothetical protein